MVSTTFTFITTFGSKGSGNGQFIAPWDIAVNSQGNVYVTDGNHGVEEYSSNGTFITSFGNAGAYGIAVDSQGNVYVIDNNSQVEEYSSSGTFITFFGSPTAHFTGYFIALDSEGNLYLSDIANHQVEEYSSSGTFITAFGSPGSGDGQFLNNLSLAVSSDGNIYVADFGPVSDTTTKNRVQEFSSNGTFINSFSTVSEPEGLAVDSAGNVYVPDDINDQVDEYSSNGTFITAFGSPGSGDGQFNNPYSLAVDSAGNVYVLDYYNNRVEKFSPNPAPKPTLLELANLSNNIYSGNNGYSDSNGTYAYVTDNFTAPNFQPPLTLTGNIYQGTRAAEYQNGNQIVVVFRGTDWNDGLAVTIKNVIADISFLNIPISELTNSIPFLNLVYSIKTAVAFLQYVEQHNPGDTITLTGHSLGGTIAQILGEATGLRTDVFDAPGAQQLYSALLPYLQSILSTNSSNNENDNYRIYGDQISLAGKPIGTEVTLAATIPYSFNAFELANPILAVVDHASAILDAHDFQQSILPQIIKLQSGSTSSVVVNSNGVGDGEISLAPLLQPIVYPTITEAILQTVESAEVPILEDLNILRFTGLAVLQGLAVGLDPATGSDFVLTEDATSPNFASIDLPTVSGVSSYNVRYETGDTWSDFQSIQPGVNNTLGTNVDGIEFAPLDANNNPITISSSFVFALSFSSNGTFNGTLTATQPSPTTDPSIVATNQNYNDNKSQTLNVSSDTGVLTNDGDPSGNPITAVLVNNPNHGTITLTTDGSFNYTPTTGFIGTDTFTYEVDNGSNLSNPATVTINVITPAISITNPSGFGSQQWVVQNTSLPYTVNFSNNAAQGTNPVEQVTITEQLDPSLDLSTFQLSNFSFGGNTYVVPQGLQNYSQKIDLTSTQGIFVDVSAGLNTTTGTVTWTFTSIDPTTGQPITDPTKGFLPPNDQTGAGSGYVSYTIQPKANLTDGTVINAQASVTFDSQTPIQSPAVFNTIEENLPSSYVNPLPTTETNPNFTVSWTGSDADSGIASYNIYVSTNGGKYVLWQNNTTATSATYNGQTGNTYSFYSVATDNLGLTEATHTKADTTTTVNQVSSLSLGVKNTLDQSNNFGSLLFDQLSNLSNTVSEVGVFATDDNGDISNPNGSSTPLSPGQTGYTQAVLSESQILYGFDPNSLRSNTYSSQNQLFTNQLANFGTQLANGNTLNSLGFYVVVNGTANQELAALNGQISHQPNVFFNIIGANSNNLNPLQVIPSTTQAGQYNLAWNGSLGNGSSFTGNLLSINTTPLNNTTDLKQGIVHPIIDTTNGSALQVNFNVTSDAAFNDFVGFYQIASTDGTLENGLKPGQAGYAKAAVSEVISSLEFDQQIGTVTHSAAVYNPVDQPWQSTLTDTFAAGKLYAPVLIANGNVQSFLAENPNNNAPNDLSFGSVGANPNAYFAFVNANSDGIDHIESLPGYTLGFKDYYGGGDLDYNDVVLHFNPANSSQIISSHAPTY